MVTMEDSAVAKSGSSKKLTEETIFGPLPDEVLQVADRIGLKRNVPISATNSFLKNRVPEKILEKDLKYQAYIFNEIKPPKKETSDAGDKRKKSNALTSDQRKRLFNLKDCKDITYAMFVEINSLWNEYIASIIDDLKSEADQLNFLRADYHGAFFVVSAAKNPALVGIKGFVVQETKNTFNIINKENRIQVVSKEGAIFAFESGGTIYKLCGNYMKFTPQHRSKVKVKVRKPGDDI